MSDLDWDAAPSAAKWYAEVIYVSAATGEIEYSYGYCSDIDEYPSPALLAESGAQIQKVKVINQETGDYVECWSLAHGGLPYSG